MNRKNKMAVIIAAAVIIFAGLLISAITYGPKWIMSSTGAPGGRSNGSVTVELAVAGDSAPSQMQQDAAKLILNKRLEGMGVFGVLFTADAGSFVIDVPLQRNQSLNDISGIIEKITGVSYFSVQEVDESKVDDNGKYLPTGRIVIDSMDVTDSETADPKGSPTVTVRLTHEAAQDFEKQRKISGGRWLFSWTTNLFPLPECKQQYPAEISISMA